MTGFTHPLRSHSRPSSHRRSPRATNEPHKRRKWMMDDTMGPDGVEMHNPSRATGGTKIFRDCARLFMQISRSCAFQQQMASCLALRRLTAPPTDGRMGCVGVQSSPHSKGQCGGIVHGTGGQDMRYHSTGCPMDRPNSSGTCLVCCYFIEDWQLCKPQPPFPRPRHADQTSC